ncbi:MAG: response regulator [Oscillospiraceae bacterium]|nr:response regulator [Oscillospiraceae bacterium]MDD7428389.1 response regulator [Oscillospiraceae bacterium]MDY2848370.1 response regulator [Oscillospiraceae bacterium]
MSLENMTVLICDDSLLARKKMVTFIRSLGVGTVVEAGDGEASVNMYKNHLPDVTFMDIVMPKVNGVDALKQILKINPDAKVIMASSVGTQENLKEAITAGAYDFLQKPLEENQVKSIIEKLAK